MYPAPLEPTPELDPAIRGGIMEKYGKDLTEKRGSMAQVRLISSLASAQSMHALAATPEQRDTKSIFEQALRIATNAAEETSNLDSEPEARLTRAIGRICSQVVKLNASVNLARQRNGITKKQAKRLGKRVLGQAYEVVAAAEDSRAMFRGTDEDKEYAKRIIAKSRASLNETEQELSATEIGNLRHTNEKYKKQLKNSKRKHKS